MVSKPVTTRSISRSALLISLAIGCGTPPSRNVSSREIVGGEVMYERPGIVNKTRAIGRPAQGAGAR